MLELADLLHHDVSLIGVARRATVWLRDAAEFVDLAASSNGGSTMPSTTSSGNPSKPARADAFTPDDGAPPPVPKDRCTKVDFLFVVDNSLSMLDEQTAIVNSFPMFMNVVEQTLGATHFHVMVVDTTKPAITSVTLAPAAHCVTRAP